MAFDVETGLHYNYHRYYDPGTGRYLTPDPIGLAGGINLFSYTNSNPINLTDQFGLTTQIPDGFWEYNKDRFTPEDFFNVSPEAQQYEIERFNKKYPFGWDNKGITDLGEGLSATNPGMGLDCIDKISCMGGCLTGFTESMPQKVKNAIRTGGTIFNIVMKAKGVATVTVKIAGKGFVVYSIAVTSYDLYRCSKVKCKQ